MRFVVDRYLGRDGVELFSFCNLHPDVFDGEAHTILRLVVHRGDGERELAEVVADIIRGVVNRFGRRFYGFLAGCKDDSNAAQGNQKCFFHCSRFMVVC